MLFRAKKCEEMPRNAKNHLETSNAELQSCKESGLLYCRDSSTNELYELHQGQLCNPLLHVGYMLSQVELVHYRNCPCFATEALSQHVLDSAKNPFEEVIWQSVSNYELLS